MSRFRSGWLVLLALLFAACCGSALHAAPALPPKPVGYFTDEAHVVDAATGSQINEQLAQFERDTSNQILVAIYPSLPEDAEIAQYSTMTYNAWGVGQKGSSLGKKGGNNGAILFVFVNNHKMFIATGRGLEGALPDATCKNIIDALIAPAFKRGDFTGGIQAGVNAMIAATKGEYTGTGRTHLEDQQAQQPQQPQYNNNNGSQGFPGWVIFIFILLFILSRVFLTGSGYRSTPYIFTGGGGGFGGFGGGGGGFGGGGGGGGGGGFSGFSGGGGSSAGGGAGGSW